MKILLQSIKLSLVLLLLFSTQAFSQVNPANFTFAGTFGGRNYYISNFPDTWPNAKALCIASGGNLAVPNSMAENTFLGGLYAVHASGWIGINDVATEGTYLSEDCATVAMVNWNAGEPNDCGSCCGSPALGEDFVELLSTGQWNDLCYGLTRYFVLELGTETSWNGSVSTDWLTAGNWSNGVPNANIATIIPAIGFSPTISANADVSTLQIQAGATLNITAGVLQISGQNIQSNGTLNMTGGTIYFAPSFCNTGAQNIAGTGTLNITHLKLNNSFGLTVSTPINVLNLVELQTGNLTSNGNLTLVSTAAQTAMVVNNGTSVVVGNATVQRHVTPYGSRPIGLGYTYFSNPTNGGTITSAFGDDLGLAFNPSYKYNCWLYPTPLSSAPFPNVYLYNESLVNTGTDAACANENLDKFETGWQSAAAGTVFTPAQGFCVNISGNTTVDVTGTLNNGNINMPITKTNAATNAGWNLVGNPYPAPIDFDLVYAANAGILTGATLRRVATGTYSGIYAYYMGGVPASGTNGGTNIIAAMQGFFARASSGGSLAFDNSVRLTSYVNPQFFRAENYFDLLKIELSSPKSKDETTLYFSAKTTNLLDNHGDAVKSLLNSSPAPNIFTMINNERVAINGFSELYDEKIIPVGFIAAEKGKHSFKISHLEGLKDAKVYLEDKKLNITHELSAKSYSFDAEKGEDVARFQIRFQLAEKRTESKLAVMLYPNPASSNVKVQFSKAVEGEITLTDLLGKSLLAEKINGLTHHFAVNHLPAGIYIVNVRTQEGTQSLKFVKE